MTDEQEPLSSGPGAESSAPPGEPRAPDVAAAVSATEPEPYPFWGYSDLLLFAGLTVPCMVLGWALVKAGFALFGFHSGRPVVELLPAQLLGYAFLFAVLRAILRMQYDRPFWSSLAWTRSRVPFLWTVIGGLATAVAVAFVAYLIQIPTVSNPMTDIMMRDSLSLVLMAVFGILVAPLSEELAFRGFLQPLVVRSLGPVAGVLVAAVPFGLLHYREYGNSWRHAVLIALAGVAFGWMRQATGSTRASTIMHASYNGLIFFVVLAQGRGVPHT